MKRAVFLLATLLVCSIARGQGGNIPNTIISVFPGAPTGACGNTMVAVRTDTGAFYDCFGAAWNAVAGGGGGSGTVTSITIAGTANQVTASGTCTITTTGTCTLSQPNAVILGTDNSAAGTEQLANGSAAAHTIFGSAATTSNTVNFFATAPVTGDLVDCVTATTVCTLTDSGVLASKVATTTNGGPLSATSPVTISAAGVIACATCTTSAASLTSGSLVSGAGGQAEQTNAGANLSAGALTLGTANTTLGQTILEGSTSGAVTLTPQAVAGTPTLTFGTSSGTPVVTASGPLAITAATGNETCATCATTTNGGAISGTAPIAVSAAGAISITGAAGQVLAGASPAFTATPALGTDNSAAGTLQLSNGSANAHTIFSSAATTTNTIAGFSAVPTNGDVVTCTVVATTCTLTDGGAPGTGTVSSVATSAPLGGGTITTTGTLTCATCVTSAASLANGGIVLGTAGTQASGTNTQLTFSAPTLTIGLAGTSSGILAVTGSTSGNATFTAPAVAGTRTNPVISSNYFQIGVPGTTSGELLLAGSTSGTATFLAPAVAGTTTNAVTMSNVLIGPAGSAAAPAYSGPSNIGWFFSGGNIEMSNGTSGQANISGIGFEARSDNVIGFSPNTDPTAAPDTNISRGAAAILDVGNGSNGNTTGKVKAAGYMSVGTTFTTNAGCSETSLAGGATAGKVASGTTGTCTFIVTMGNSATAPNGWACKANDLTTTADSVNQTATTTTTATFSGTTVTADVINFFCMGY